MPNKGAWHGDPTLKAEVFARMLEHRVQDTITQGFYQKVEPEKAIGYRGCLIGCTLPLQANACGDYVDPGRTWHNEVSKLYGIPVQIGYLLDWTFERLPVEKAPWFAVAFIEATPVGADMQWVIETLDRDLVERFGAPEYGNDGPDLEDPLTDLIYHDYNVTEAVRQADFLWIAETIIDRVRQAPIVQHVEQKEGVLVD